MAELDIRVEDFLDDKLQSTTDFEELDNLLSNIETQRAQLQSQLDSAAAELETARQTSAERQTSLDRQIADFKKLQQSIDVRMRIIASSDAPDEAIRRLEQPMKQLHKVDLAIKYLELLQDVEQLTKETRACLPGDPRAALEPYTQLRELSGKLKELQGPADEAASHLVAYVADTAEALWAEMKRTMWKEMDALLTARKWRNEPDAMEEADEEWLTCFEKLIDLQVPEVIYSEQVVTLLPMDVMAHVFVKEFNFHFMGKIQTSSLQSLGTHCFPWFLSLIENWEDFFRDNFGYVLASRFQSTMAKHGTVYLDPTCALVTSMLPVMREKIQSIEAEALLNPSTLSSVVSQLLAFDDEIRNRFGYDGGDPEKGWAGLASEFLHRNFDAWLRAEKDFALERFRGILATPDARNIDYDYAVQGKNKPTFGAVRVMDLLHSVTVQYQRVRRFSHKLRFLIEIQLAILDDYHDRLRGSLEAYYSMTSTVGRTLHGATREQLAALEGTGALETLCKVFGSADHVVATLRDWGNEEFFVTLWEQLNSRSKKHEDPDNFAGEMSFAEVKDRTSTSVGSDEDGGILFDETIAAYSQRRKAAQDFLAGALVDSHQKVFRPYLTRVQWQTVNEATRGESRPLLINWRS
jgi:RAD50-interacting protein 1